VSGRGNRLLGSERGQTLVLFVVILSGLVVLLAFVVDVGAWLGTKHKLQNVADAAALAAVQVPGQSSPSVNGDGWATLEYQPDPSGGTVSPLDAVTVTATHEAPIIFGRIAGIGSFDVKAIATAQAQAVSSLNNAKLTAVVDSSASGPPYISPIVVNRCVIDASCLTGTCFGPSQQCDLNYNAIDPNFNPGDLESSRFGIAMFDGTSFKDAASCNPCLGGQVSTGATRPQLQIGVSGSDAVTAMNTTIGRKLILPVFDSFSSGEYSIIGFSAFVVTTTQFDGDPLAGNWRPQGGGGCTANCKIIRGYFTDYTLPASFEATNPTAQDFGVRGIGLIENS
jgi:hypothetical protein